MADTWLYWAGAYDGADLHIVRGQWSIPLFDLVRIRRADGSTQSSAEADDVTWSVSTRLRGWTFPAPPDDPAAADLDDTTFHGGVSDLEVRSIDGALRPLGQPGDEIVPAPDADGGLAWSEALEAAVRPGLKIRNVAVTIHASIDGVSAEELPPKRLRVHVHDLVNQIWLAPDPIRLPRARVDDADEEQSCFRRLAVMAQFDTGAVADIGTFPTIDWSALTLPEGAGCTDNGWLFASRDADLGTGQIRATLPSALGGASAQAEVEVVAAWDERPPSERTIVDLSGSWRPGDGLDDLDVLLVGDGIPAADHADFLDTCRALAGAMTQAVRPDIGLLDGLRVWAWAPPSPTDQVTFRTPLRGVHGHPDAWNPDTRPLSPTGAAELTQRHTAWMFDVPGPETDAQLSAHEDPDPDDVPDPGAYFIARWRLLFDMTDEEAAMVDGQQQMRWAWEGRRVQTEPADTPLGVTGGADDTFTMDADRLLGQRHEHVRPAELQFALSSLLLPDGTAVDDHWASGGRAEGLSVILAAGHLSGGTNREHPPASWVSIPGRGARTITVTEAPPSCRQEPADWRHPDAEAVTSITSVIIHELGHALGLGDEYAEFLTTPSDSARYAVWPNLDVDAPHDDGDAPPHIGVHGADGTLQGLSSTAMASNGLHRVRRAWTTTGWADVKVAGADDAFFTGHGVTPIDGGRGAIAVQLTPAAAAEIPPSGDGSDRLAIMDAPTTVILRRRRRRRQGAPIPVGAAQPVTVVHDGDVTWAIVREADTDALATAVRDHRDTWAASEPAPILLQPVPVPEQPGSPAQDDPMRWPATPDGWARLLSRTAAHHIDRTGRPFDIGDSDPWPLPDVGADPVQRRPRNMPPISLGAPWWPSRRVPGLWTGGGRHTTGVYRPTSQTIMRSRIEHGMVSRAPATEDPVTGDTVPGPPTEDELAIAAGATYDDVHDSLAAASGHTADFGPVNTYLLIDHLDPLLHEVWDETLDRWCPDGATWTASNGSD